MKLWRKILLTGLSAVVISAAGTLVAACGPGNIENNFVTYDNQTITVSGKQGEEVAFPEVSRDGYEFEGWYLSEDYSGSPVTSATFDESVTYYAKWAKLYAITLDTEGGILSSTTLYLKEGENVYDFMQNYVPVKGDYQFGGWFVGDEELSATAKMTTSGLTLTARYKAAYTVNVYLQNADLDTYTYTAEYATGYALIDEEYDPEISIEGYTLSVDDDASIIISENAAENVYNYHFDRNEYTLLLSTNYPDGTTTVTTETHYYGIAFDLPVIDYTTASYRFLGWSAKPDARFEDVIDNSGYTLTGDTVLYAVWNKGYVDMFSGEDCIFLNYDEDNTAVLIRGGVEIPGTYDVKRKWYDFTSETTGFAVHAKLNDNGTFVYYSNRKGTYYLYTGSGLSSEVTIVLDDLNGIEYYSTVDKIYLEGTYAIDESGLYVANFEDGSSFAFILGTYGDSYAFRIRGAEYDYGALAYMGTYYPVIVFNGFGTATYISTTSQTTYSYQIIGDVVTLYSMYSVAGTIKIIDYGAYYGYEFYTSALDRVFSGENSATLTLNGCSTAVYEEGSTKIVGTYTYATSYFGGYIITVTSDSATYVYLVNYDGATYYFEEKNTGYAEYLYVRSDGYLDVPYLIDNGDGTATIYEEDANGELQAVSTGTLVKSGYSYIYTVSQYLYTVDETNPVEYVTANVKALVVNIDTTSTSYSIYYWISSTDVDGNTTDYTDVYTAADGSTLAFVPYFAVYTDKDGNTVAGLYTEYTTYIAVSVDGSYYYFTLDEDNKTFETLTNAPLVLKMKRNGVTNSNVTLIVSGKELSEGKYEAVYSETTAEGVVNHSGYYTAELVSAVTASAYIYTFVSDDGAQTFKFIVTTSGSTYYFNYYDTDEVITLTTYTEISDSDTEDTSSTLVVTDEKTENGYVLVYTNGDVSLKGTFTYETVYAFKEYEATVYTFTATDGTTFKFTIINTYFRICAEAASYTAADGSELTLDGATHMARYIDADFNYYDSYYLVATSILDENQSAIYMMVGDTLRYFDLNDEKGTFEIRGLEAAAYLKIVNGTPDGEVIALDGHGGAVIYGDTETEATYTAQGDVYTVVTEDNVSYVGKLGTYTYSDTTYYAFYIIIDNIAGSYLNKDDLSVLVLDDAGNATLFDSLGVREEGSYVVLSDSLFYYENSDGTEAAMYAYGNGLVVKSVFYATYYADDFASIVFYQNGVVLFNNSNAKYFYYNAAEAKIYTYTPSDSAAANEYGFVVEELGFDITSDTISYTDTVTGKTRTYNYYNGQYITFTDAAGNTLVFQPTGEATFTVEATYTESGSTEGTDYYVVVSYDDDGEVITYMAAYEAINLSGSVYRYQFLANYDLTLHFDTTSFVLDKGNYSYGLYAYDYTYVSLYETYGSSLTAMFFTGYYGYISIIGEVEDGEVTYTLSGKMNYITGDDGAVVTLTDGILSVAGYYNSYYGNMFTAEFTGSDGEIYHMNFFLTYNSTVGVYTYIIYTFTRVTESFDLGNGTVVYNEEYLYTTGFQIVKGVDEETGEDVYYVKGDAFYPSIKYKGQIINVALFSEGENEWVFVSYEYLTASYTVYLYDFVYTTDDDGNIIPGTLSKLTTGLYDTADAGVGVYALYDVETGEIIEVVGLVNGATTTDVTDCVKNEDGSFTVTVGDKTYTVTFSETTDDDGNTVVTATLVEVIDDSNEEGSSEGTAE